MAALLHDVGHLLDGQDEDLADRGVDGRHEEAGCAWLARHFGPEVTEPIRLHVAAKRYLCAVAPSYLAGLSPASRLSLSLQGGPMSEDERAEFESNPSHDDAVRLRHWDDTAKVPGLDVPGLEHYRERITRLLESRPGWNRFKQRDRPARSPDQDGLFSVSMLDPRHYSDDSAASGHNWIEASSRRWSDR